MAYKGYIAGLANSPRTIRQSDKEFNTLIYQDDFYNSQSFEEVFLNDSVSATPVQIVKDAKIPTIKTILMYPGIPLKTGDLITRSDDSIWLTQMSELNVMYYRGKIEKTNHLLKWIDEHGLIQAHAAVLYFNARSNFGTAEDKIMNLPDGRRQVTLQYNQHTIKLRRDDRFIFGDEAFKVIDYDYVSDEGLVNLSFESDQVHVEDDNLELGIANYKSKINNIQVEILNGEHLEIGVGESVRLNVEVKDKKGVGYNEEIKYESSNPEIVLVDEFGLLTGITIGSAIVTVGTVYGVKSYISIQTEEILIPEYTANIQGSDTISYGKSSSYQATFYENGNIISTPCLWAIVGEDGTTVTSLATISNQIDSSCVVKANNQQKSGYVLLRVKNEDSQIGEIVAEKRIRIKSLL